MESSWILTFEPTQLEHFGLYEALCTLGNGFFACRGALEEAQASDKHYPGTYLAGCYNQLTTPIAGHNVEHEDLVNLPNWLTLNFYPVACKADWLSNSTAIWHYLELNLRQGILQRTSYFKDNQNRETRIVSQRLISMHNKHIGAIQYQITPLNWSGDIVIQSTLDGSITNSGVARYSQLTSQHWQILTKELINDDTIGLWVSTTQSHIELAQVARTQIFLPHGKCLLKPDCHQTEKTITQVYQTSIKPTQAITIEKVVSLFSSRDFAIKNSRTAAITANKQAGCFHNLLQLHQIAWQQLWQHFDIELTPPSQEQQLIRLHTFHLLQTISPHSIELDVGAPARGLHGEAYRGHVFWDELFILPFYTLRFPAITRSLLLYRYRRLDAARQLAREAGFRGAMYPWQSASDGSETSQLWHLNPRSNTWGPDYSSLQRHINIAIAYNIQQYYHYTADLNFLTAYGAEMLLEIARFWASIATFNTKKKRYEIKGVMGPDEYHEQYPASNKQGIDNNAYTNIMAVWVIKQALAILEILPADRVQALRKMLNISSKELARWRKITTLMYVPFLVDGIISQFEYYEQLKEFPWQAYQMKYGNIERLDRILKSENDTPNNYKLAKQADVVMLFYLLPFTELQSLFEQLGYNLSTASAKRTVEYYLARTSHGSTLSRIVFASVFNDFKPNLANQLYWQALVSDFEDSQKGSTKEGIHLGIMAGTVNYITKHYAGISVENNQLMFQPQLPITVKNLKFRIQFHGNIFAINITKTKFKIRLMTKTYPQKIMVGQQILYVTYDKAQILNINIRGS